MPAHQTLWSAHDVANGHERRYDAASLGEACVTAGWTIVRATYFNTSLLPAAALVRRLRRGARETRSELTLTPPSLDGLLSVPMRLEARLIGSGRRLPTGLSLAAILVKPAPVRAPPAA